MRQSREELLVGFGIGAIIVMMVVGPFKSPPEFSWLLHTTSEQAGQQMPGAWIMRYGFVAYGLTTLIAAALDWSTRTWVRFSLIVFGAGLIGTAIWSNASIVPGVVSNLREDELHSLVSTVVGTAFACACATRLFAPGGSARDMLAWLGLLVAVTFPLGMETFPEYRGLIQRAMFVVSFVFVGREFHRPTA